MDYMKLALDIYQLACILLTVPVSSAGCEWALSKFCLLKYELCNVQLAYTMEEHLNGFDDRSWKEHSEWLEVADIL